MKFYQYPLAIVAYALIFVFVIVFAWHYVGDTTPAAFWYYFPAGAGIYLLISFILSLLKLDWQLDVLLQVGFVLAPVLWYVNQKEPYKRPVFIFLINSEHRGKLDILFNQAKDAETNVRSSADTLYFKFDEDGKILLNEDGAYVRASMKKNLFVFYPDLSQKRATFATLDKLPADTTKIVFVEDSAEADNGRMKALHYRIDFPQKLKGVGGR